VEIIQHLKDILDDNQEDNEYGILFLNAIESISDIKDMFEKLEMQF